MVNIGGTSTISAIIISLWDTSGLLFNQQLLRCFEYFIGSSDIISCMLLWSLGFNNLDLQLIVFKLPSLLPGAAL